MKTKTIQRVAYLSMGMLLTYMAFRSCEKKPSPQRVHTPSVASAEQSLVPDWCGKYTGRKDKYLNQIYNGKD